MWEEVAPALEPVFAKLWAAYSRHRLTARTVTLKIKYANFRQITRSRSCAEAIASRAMIEQFSLDLRQPHSPPPRGVRLLGVTSSNINSTTVAESGQTVLAIASRESPWRGLLRAYEPLAVFGDGGLDRGGDFGDQGYLCGRVEVQGGARLISKHDFCRFYRRRLALLHRLSLHSRRDWVKPAMSRGRIW